MKSKICDDTNQSPTVVRLIIHTASLNLKIEIVTNSFLHRSQSSFIIEENTNEE